MGEEFDPKEVRAVMDVLIGAHPCNYLENVPIHDGRVETIDDWGAVLLETIPRRWFRFRNVVEFMWLPHYRRARERIR